MSDPISTDDLYGPSNPPVPEGTPVQQPQPNTDPPLADIPIEETPEIIVEPPMPAPAPVVETATTPVLPPESPKNKTSILPTVGAAILFLGLFGLGMWLSSYVRQYLPDWLVGITPQQQEITSAPPLAGGPTPTPADPFATWKTYQVISGATKLPIAGLSYKLPGDILEPVCDTTTCISQGTYLTGGSRFTVAPRGIGQLLVDFRGSAISDVGGMLFTAKDTQVNGHAAKMFTGIFAGRTVGGFGFTQMRGYMIEVTPVLSLEINHFTPTGVTADFEADDLLFDRIVSMLVMPGTPSATPIVTAAPEATSSGY